MSQAFRLILRTAGVFFLCFAVTVASATDPHQAHREALNASSPAKGSSETSVTLPEVVLVDQNGNKALVADFLNGRTLVVDFIFTSCRTICPVLTTTLKRTQEKIPDDQKDAILFVSISVDPTNDTPEKLKAYSKKMSAQEDWLWLTGSSGAVKQVLRAFGSPTGGQPEDHPPMILVGHTNHSSWYRWVGIPPIDDLADAALDMSAEVAKVGHHAQHH